MLNEARKSIRFGFSFFRKELVHLNLQLLYDCNFTCKICEFWKPPFRNSARLTADQVQTIADRLKGHGSMIVSIGGGEPLLHGELPRIVEILAKDHFPVMICNGWFVTAENAKTLFASGLYEVSVSLDYADPERHDAQRGAKGAFDRAVRALRFLQENRTRPDQRVHMITVVMDDNLDDIEPLIRLAKEIGVTYLITFYSSNRGFKQNKTPPAEVSRRLLELRDNYPEFVALPGFLDRFGEAVNGGILPCYAGKNLFNIDCRGNVSRCIDTLDQDVGNIFTDDFGGIRTRLLEEHRRNECGKCWTSCRGSVESIMYGDNRMTNLLALHKMTKSVPLLRRPS